jgi:hypothetical protein
LPQEVRFQQIVDGYLLEILTGGKLVNAAGVPDRAQILFVSIIADALVAQRI